jgi:hypothetical protein
MTLVTAAFLLSCVVIGVGLTGHLPVALRLEERLPIGAVVGAMAVTLVALGTIAGFGFSGTTVMVAVMVAAGLSMPGLLRVAPSVQAEYADFRVRLHRGWRDPSSPMPLLVLCGVTWPLTVRILSLAYQPSPSGGIAAGHLSTFGDWQAHLAYTGNFAYRGDLHLGTPLAAGDDFAYHFGVDLFAALTVPTGASLHAALQITSGYLAFALVPVLYLFGRRLFARRSVAVLGSVLFLAAGGWGFTRFLDDVSAVPAGSFSDRFRQVLWNQPRDYTRDFDTYWMDNPVLGHLYPQRPTLVGFAVVLLTLAILWAARESGERGAFLWAGVVVGFTPLFHTFGWGTALVMGVLWAITDRFWTAEARRWLWFLVPAVVLAVPAVGWLAPPDPDGTFRWVWGWVTDGTPQGLVGFWFDNTGLFPLLFAVALLWRGATSRRLAVALAPIWLWFVGVHLAIPHPWEGNNAKYAIFWWMLGAFAVAALLAAVVDRVVLSARPGAVAMGVFGVGLVVVSLTAAGGLDLFKAVDGTLPTYPAEVASPGEVLVGEWVRVSTADDAVFVTASSSASQPVATLGGRAVVTAFDGWVFDLGLDWSGRRQASIDILAGAPTTGDLIEQYGVDYVVIGPRELAAGASTDHWDRSGTLVYDFGQYRIYRP